ncbi:hypothetical protein HYDPIDRAFT_109239 [Hydnomerulius pinastri MD-312]|nr:hypothetical protein HYDPIDRAFT_109239 [Hydnomerulius pinastri MD-312]
MLLDLPQETLLHILSFLDIPDLASLSHVSVNLALLAADPVLQRMRLLVVAPSRVDHSLFGKSPEGILLRPTVPELVHRGVMRGIQIERRWRAGAYFYSPHSVKQYESGQHLQKRHTKVLLSAHLRTRLSAPHTLQSLYSSHVLPDIESSTLSFSRSLLPVVRQLKWSIQKDNMARIIRASTCGLIGGSVAKGASHPFNSAFGAWVELKGQNIFGDTERVRLALCPDVGKMIRFYEDMD